MVESKDKPPVLGRKKLQPLILAKFYGFDPEMDIDWEVLEIACEAQRDEDVRFYNRGEL